MENRLQEFAESYRAEADERRNAFESQAGVLQKSLEAAAEDRKRLEREIRAHRNGGHGPCVIF